MSSTPLDVLVIGAGPAGLTVATEAARAGLKALCLDKLAPGGALINLTELHDFDEPWPGPDMAARLTDEAAVAGAEVGFGEVSRLAADANGSWTVETTDGETHVARAVVIATGLNKGKLGLPGEAEFEGRGISHCASCDGPLYAGLPVVVAGTGGWAAHEARELAGVASDVTVIGDLSGENPSDMAHIQGRISELQGANGLEAIVVETGAGAQTVQTSAVFVYVGQSPAAEFLPDSLARDASGHIVVDAEGRTSAATVFAVGDVRTGARQYLSDAISDGMRAAQAIVAMLKTTN